MGQFLMLALAGLQLAAASRAVSSLLAVAVCVSGQSLGGADVPVGGWANATESRGLSSSVDYLVVSARAKPSFSVATYRAGDIVSNGIRHSGFWDRGTSTIMLLVLSSIEDGVVVDFGANIGWFSLLARSRDRDVIAIEAMSSNVAAMEMGMTASHFELTRSSLNYGGGRVDTLIAASPGVTLYHAALDSRPGGTLCVSPRSEGNVGNGEVKVGEHGATCQDEIGVTTLDSVVDRPVAFLKADCEGCEANALLGAVNLLAGLNAPCAMAVEWRPRNIAREGGDPAKFVRQIEAAGYYALRQRGHPISGIGLNLTAVVTPLEETPADLVLLLNTERCYPHGGERHRSLVKRAALGPDLGFHLHGSTV